MAVEAADIMGVVPDTMIAVVAEDHRILQQALQESYTPLGFAQEMALSPSVIRNFALVAELRFLLQ